MMMTLGNPKGGEFCKLYYSKFMLVSEWSAKTVPGKAAISDYWTWS